MVRARGSTPSWGNRSPRLKGLAEGGGIQVYPAGRRQAFPTAGRNVFANRAKKRHRFVSCFCTKSEPLSRFSLVFVFLSCLPCLVLPRPTLMQSRVPLKSVLNLRSYNLERTLELLDQVNLPPCCGVSFL